MVKISFDIPKAMRDVAQSEDVNKHPQNLCFECPFRGVTCDGANEQAMTMPERIDWLKRLGKKNGITREKAALMANTSINTVNAIMTGRTEDPRHSTMMALSKAYNGGCWGKYPCHIAALLITGQLEESAPDPNSQTQLIELEHLRERVTYIKEEESKKVAYLVKEIEELKKTRRFLIGIIFAILLLIILYICV